MIEKTLRKYGYIRVDKFCQAMNVWARVCQEELPGDSEYILRWRRQFREHWTFIQLANTKSCLLDRLIYGGETLREKMCPIHKGHWSGCNITGEDPCQCAHDTCITCFSRTIGYPFAAIKTCAMWGGKDRYYAMALHHTLIKEGTMEEVLDVVEASVPPDTGPAIYGTDDDLAG